MCPVGEQKLKWQQLFATVLFLKKSFICRRKCKQIIEIMCGFDYYDFNRTLAFNQIEERKLFFLKLFLYFYAKGKKKLM